MTANEESALEELVWELTAPHTQEEISNRLGISQQRVDKLEKRALSKLRALVDDDWKPDKPPPGGGNNITLVV
jgi:DNA-directed RNA polymerase sigma subunit (sigma70/sigma32)